MSWFTVALGPPRAIVLPSRFSGATSIEPVFAGIAEHMGIDPAGVGLELYAERQLAFNGGPAHGAAGHYHTRNGRPVIAIETGRSRTSLVSTIAHELGHVLLLGEGRISHTRRDHEPLTDLLTVYFGLGIFSANSAFEFSSHQSGWSWARLGYLTEPMYGYALARFALLHHDPKPAWAEHVDLNPRGHLRQGLRYLLAQDPPPAAGAAPTRAATPPHRPETP